MCIKISASSKQVSASIWPLRIFHEISFRRKQLFSFHLHPQNIMSLHKTICYKETGNFVFVFVFFYKQKSISFCFTCFYFLEELSRCKESFRNMLLLQSCFFIFICPTADYLREISMKVWKCLLDLAIHCWRLGYYFSIRFLGSNRNLNNRKKII